MPQISLYLDDDTMELVRAGAAAECVSLSKYVCHRIEGRQPRCNTPSGLPDGLLERLYGSIDDDTFVRPEQLDFSLDAPRLTFD